MKNTKKIKTELLTKLSLFSKRYSALNELENFIGLKCFHLENGEYDFFYYIDADSLFFINTNNENNSLFKRFGESDKITSSILKKKDDYIFGFYFDLFIINKLYNHIEKETMNLITKSDLFQLNKLYRKISI